MVVPLLFIVASLAQAPDAVPQREPDTLPQELGVYGTVRPGLGDVRLADRPVHSDVGGRAAHQLIDLAGSDGHGFAAIWRDGRDGNAGLYFGRLDATGEPLEPERALYPEGSAWRELEPAIALSPRGDGAFVWYSSGSPVQRLKLRTFDSHGVLAPQAALVGNAPDAVNPPGRPSAFGESSPGESRRPGGARVPALALAESSGAVAWGENGTLWIQGLSATGELQGSPRQLSTKESALAGPPRLCAGRATRGAPKGAIACAWTTREGVVFEVLGEEEHGPRALGAGVLERLVAAPGTDAGWWALVETSAGHRLLSVPGARAVDLGFSPREACDVAVRGDEFLLSVQRANGTLELFTLDPSAAEARPKSLASLDPAGTAVGDPRIACSGEDALVAWTATAARQSDVFFRTLAGEKLGAAQRWNHDEASSVQKSGRIAARGGERAVAVWLDARTGVTELLARWVGVEGKWLGEEIAVTPGGGADASSLLAGEPADPCVAMDSGGGFLVAWKQAEKRGYRLFARAFDAAGKPRSGSIELDAGTESLPAFKADLDAAPFGTGYAVAFASKDRGVFVRTVAADGRAAGAAVPVFEHPCCQDVALAELDGGSLAVAWDITVPGAGNKAVRARLFSPALEPGATIEPPLSVFGDDWDPALAPVDGGGFALAFVGGAQHNRDVFLRFFDARGAVASPLVPITTRMNEQDFPTLARLSDGSLCVGFEDDLSAYDHVYVRRVSRGKAGGPAAVLGPCRTLDERAAVLNESRNYPRVAPLAGGAFAAVWIDCSRARGTDVCVKVVGPKFDE
ncbi:MAG TPA: hypothetical protein VM509_02555 [Planctomycetota bacterium]|nr:hypothetical protein [Planctomycetota bacterium]